MFQISCILTVSEIFDQDAFEFYMARRNWAMTSWRQLLRSGPKLSNDILKARFTWRTKTEQWHPEGTFYMARQNWAMTSWRQVLQWPKTEQWRRRRWRRRRQRWWRRRRHRRRRRTTMTTTTTTAPLNWAMTSWRIVLHGAPKLSNDILKASFTVARNWAMTSWRQVLHSAPKLSNDMLKSSFIQLP